MKRGRRRRRGRRQRERREKIRGKIGEVTKTRGNELRVELGDRRGRVDEWGPG